MKIGYFLLLISLQGMSQVENDSVTKNLIKEIVFCLSDDSLHGRMSGSLDEVKALSYIEQKMYSINNNKFFRQKFSFKRFGFPLIKATNGYVFVDNNSKETVLFSAHYDHIGYGNELSTKFKENEVHNGADDNASGVALIISLYKDLVKNKNKNKNYLFVFYSGHEMGLFGSDVFSKLITKKKKHFKEIIAVLNFDMVGRMDNELKWLKCFSNKKAKTLLEKVPSSDFDINLKIEETKQLELLDTKPFLNKKNACFSFTTGIHLDYHSPSDDAKYINLHGMLKTQKYLLQLIDTIE